MKIFSKLLGLMSIIALSTVAQTFAYTQEQQEAYYWAYNYGITTQPTIEEARLDGNLTRQAFAKMIVNYLENLVGVNLTSNSCNFPDESKIVNDLKIFTKKTCGSQIMGKDGTSFKPTDLLSRAQLGTVLSRVLRGDLHNSNGKGYYIYHVNALKDAGIMNNISNVNIPAKRGDVLIMLKRMYEKFGSSVNISGEKNSTYNINETVREKDAIDYNDKIVDFASSCIDSESNVWDNYSTGNVNIKELKDAVDNTIKTCQNSIIKINELGDFNGDDSLKNSVLLLVSNTISYYKQFKKLIPYLDIEELSDEQQKDYENIIDKLSTLNNILIERNEKIIVVQEQFSKKYGFELENTNNENNNIDNYDEEYRDIYSAQEIIYVGKDGTPYTYNTGIINLLINTANAKGESDLSDYLKIEANFFGSGLEEIGNFDKEEFFKELGVDLDSIDKENLTKKEKEELVENFGKWVEKMMNKNKDRNNKFIGNLEKIVNNIEENDDKFGLKEKYAKSKDYIEISNSFLDSYGEMISSLIKISLTKDEENDDKGNGEQAFELIGLSLAMQSSVMSYQSYLNGWGINTIELLGGELVE